MGLCLGGTEGHTKCWLLESTKGLSISALEIRFQILEENGWERPAKGLLCRGHGSCQGEGERGPGAWMWQPQALQCGVTDWLWKCGDQVKEEGDLLRLWLPGAC